MSKNGSSVKVPAKRRLTDLYHRGKTVRINDDSDNDPIEIYLSKVNDLENKRCIEKASASRAKFLVLQNDKGNPERDLYLDQLNALGLDNVDSLVGIVSAPKMAEEEASIQSRIEHDEDTWGKDNLLESLREAWRDGAEEDFRSDEPSKDSKRIHDQLEKFDKEVAEEIEVVRQEVEDAYRLQPMSELLEEAVDRLLEIEGSNSWMSEYYAWRLFYAVRETDDHDARYFETREEIDTLDSKILERLIAEYKELEISGVEGKD